MKRQPTEWATALMQAAKMAFSDNVNDPIAERERKMAVAIEDRVAGCVGFCRRYREIYGPEQNVDAALAAIGIQVTDTGEVVQ